MARFFRGARPAAIAALCLGLIALSGADLRGQEGKLPFKKGGGSKDKASSSEIKKYDDVITKEAKTSPGVFLVHRVADKVYFEIPQDGLGKLMLWTIEVVKGPAGVTWGGQSLGNRVVRFERRGNKVYLWSVSF